MRHLLAALTLAAAGCGAPPRAGAGCGPDTCGGCCALQSIDGLFERVCVGGTENAACGGGGLACDSCGGGRTCLAQACAWEAFPANAKLAFVTRTTWPGNLGGLAGADQRCASAAGAAGMTGAFRAWLSTGVSAFDRIASDGPWYLPGVDLRGHRVRVFGSKAALASAPLAAIAQDERGAPVKDGVEVWTGTPTFGVARLAGDTCLDWTTDSSSERGSTAHAARACDAQLALYCLEQ